MCSVCCVLAGADKGDIAGSAECNGHLLRSVNHLDLKGARWVPDDEGRYRIVNCPDGIAPYPHCHAFESTF